MKYRVFIPLLVLLFIFLSGCKSEEEAVTGTAKKFLTYMDANNYDKLRKMSTPESKSMLDFMESMASFNKSGEKPKSIENLNCKINFDTARCTYTQGDEEKSLLLVKLKNKWLVEMKKESPSFSPTDSASEEPQTNTYNTEPDTTTYFDLVLSEMKEELGDVKVAFEFSDRSDWSISHLWLDVYFIDKNGKFMQKKQIYFDGLLKDSMMQNISNADEIKKAGKVYLTLEKTQTTNIGEIYMVPFRLRMEPAYYDVENYYYLDNIYSFAKYHTLIKNKTEYDVKITFE